MPLPTVDQAYEALQHAPARGAVQVDVDIRIATFSAAVQADAARIMANASTDSARTIAAASDALRNSVEAFTAASNAGTNELAKWSAATARWTMWLTFATIALFLSAIAQVVVMLLAQRR